MLILSGGGNAEVSFEVDERYFAFLKKGAKILYIPEARSSDKFDSCRGWFSTLLSKHNRDDDITFVLQQRDERIPELEDFDALYIGGGNTYRLLDYVQSTPLGIKLAEYISRGGLVYGGSAGAIIFGKNIRTAGAEKENYTREDGLNFLENRVLDCHYEPSADERLLALAKELDVEILGLPENSAIFIDVGAKKKFIVGGVVFSFRNGVKRKITALR